MKNGHRNELIYPLNIVIFHSYLYVYLWKMAIFQFAMLDYQRVTFEMG